MCNSYNEYKNYETWAVSLSLDNDYDVYQHWHGRRVIIESQSDYAEQVKSGIWTWQQYTLYTLASEIEESIKGKNPFVDQANIYTDLLNAALSVIDWVEVAQSFCEE